MSTFTELTPDQQTATLAFMAAFRPLMGQAARLFNAIQGLENAWNANVSAAVTSLDAGTTIPDQTGLAGAQSLQREDLIGTMADLATALSTFNTAVNIAVYIRAAGLANTQ